MRLLVGAGLALAAATPAMAATAIVSSIAWLNSGQGAVSGVNDAFPGGFGAVAAEHLGAVAGAGGMASADGWTRYGRIETRAALSLAVGTGEDDRVVQPGLVWPALHESQPRAWSIGDTHDLLRVVAPGVTGPLTVRYRFDVTGTSALAFAPGSAQSGADASAEVTVHWLSENWDTASVYANRILRIGNMPMLPFLEWRSGNITDPVLGELGELSFAGSHQGAVRMMAGAYHRMDVQADCHVYTLNVSAAEALEGSCSAGFTWGGIVDVRDEDGNIVSGWTIESSSGFDYANAWDGTYDGVPIDVPFNLAPPPGVPEPATWALMILGFGLVGGAARRKAGRAPRTA